MQLIFTISQEFTSHKLGTIQLILTISMSDFVIFVSKFLEIYVQYGIKATSVASRLVRQDRMSDSCKIIISGPCSLIFVAQFYGDFFSFFVSNNQKIRKRKTAIAIATNIFIIVYKNQIFEHIRMVYNGIIVNKVAEINGL